MPTSYNHPSNNSLSSHGATHASRSKRSSRKRQTVSSSLFNRLANTETYSSAAMKGKITGPPPERHIMKSPTASVTKSVARSEGKSVGNADNEFFHRLAYAETVSSAHKKGLIEEQPKKSSPKRTNNAFFDRMSKSETVSSAYKKGLVEEPPKVPTPRKTDNAFFDRMSKYETYSISSKKAAREKKTPITPRRKPFVSTRPVPKGNVFERLARSDTKAYTLKKNEETEDLIPKSKTTPRIVTKHSLYRRSQTPDQMSVTSARSAKSEKSFKSFHSNVADYSSPRKALDFNTHAKAETSPRPSPKARSPRPSRTTIISTNPGQSNDFRRRPLSTSITKPDPVKNKTEPRPVLQFDDSGEDDLSFGDESVEEKDTDHVDKNPEEVEKERNGISPLPQDIGHTDETNEKIELSQETKRMSGEMEVGLENANTESRDDEVELQNIDTASLDDVLGNDDTNDSANGFGLINGTFEKIPVEEEDDKEEDIKEEDIKEDNKEDVQDENDFKQVQPDNDEPERSEQDVVDDRDDDLSMGSGDEEEEEAVEKSEIEETNVNMVIPVTSDSLDYILNTPTPIEEESEVEESDEDDKEIHDEHVNGDIIGVEGLVIDEGDVGQNIEEDDDHNVELPPMKYKLLISDKYHQELGVQELYPEDLDLVDSLMAFEKDEVSKEELAILIIEALFERDFEDGENWEIDAGTARDLEEDEGGGGDLAGRAFVVKRQAKLEWNDLYSVAASKGTIIISEENEEIKIDNYSYFVAG